MNVQIAQNRSLLLCYDRPNIAEIFHRLSALDPECIEKIPLLYFSDTYAIHRITSLGLSSPNPRTVELMKSAILATFTEKVLEDDPSQDSILLNNVSKPGFPKAVLRAFFNKNHSVHQSIDSEKKRILRTQCKEEVRKTIEYVLGVIDTIQPTLQSDDSVIFLRDFKNLFNGKKLHKLK